MTTGSRSMACLCAPTDHPGSFRCRLHRSTELHRESVREVPTRTSQMACLCAPTEHAGSFRCRLHRSKEQHWGGRQLKSPPKLGTASTEEASSVYGGSGKRLPLARSTRISIPISSESIKLMEKVALVGGTEEVQEMAASVKELSISPADGVPKKSLKLAANSTAASVAGILKEVQEKVAASEFTLGKGDIKEATSHQHHKLLKKRNKDRRSRARSDVVTTIVMKDLMATSGLL